MSKVTKIEYDIKPSPDVDKQPTIHVYLFGSIKVFFEDEKQVELEIEWDDCPNIKNSSELSKEEIEEINKLLDSDGCDGLWKAAEDIANKIVTISSTGVIET